MTKKAVLIGLNYPGTDAELKGCINDVWTTHRFLTERYEFLPEDINVLIDTDPNYTQPTGANIRQALTNLIQSAESGDILYVHYSGHGTRVPAETGDEDDTGFDECIVPSDMNLITGDCMQLFTFVNSLSLFAFEIFINKIILCCTDDDFREFIDQVPCGVKITIIADACHSGGLIAGTEEQIGDSKDPDHVDEGDDLPPPETRYVMQIIFRSFFFLIN